jgi:hypothetical protein
VKALLVLRLELQQQVGLATLLGQALLLGQLAQLAEQESLEDWSLLILLAAGSALRLAGQVPLLAHLRACR